MIYTGNGSSPVGKEKEIDITKCHDSGVHFSNLNFKIGIYYIDKNH